jgi:hypothetical protein
MTKPRVSTAAFEFAHGKKPRGTGTWAFFFDGARDVRDAFWFTGTFAEAKAKAVAFAHEHGHTTVSVGS